MSFLSKIFPDSKERYVLLLIILIVSLIAIFLANYFGGIFFALSVVIPFITALLTICKNIWSSDTGQTKVALTSIGAILLLVLGATITPGITDVLLEPLYNRVPALKGIIPAIPVSFPVMIIASVVILCINYFMRDNSAMIKHSTPIEKEFPEKDYKKLLESFSGMLLDDLNKIDRDTNWSADIFIPLDAEVEVKTGSKRLKKVTDLLSAIRSDRQSRVFLVLGDPGSGKSVALRKLCRDLLKEVQKTGKVPLYINLREWETEEVWTEQNPPTVEELYNFVLNNLKDRGNVFTNDFLDKYFKKMFENGRLFIVLDSFDEIPSVMDVDESSWLIDKLSDVIYRFLANGHESRGILASRIFRRPTDKFDAKTIFEIRPFTENKIVESLEKSLSYDESLVTLLFNQRQELIPVARNPFTAALISSYAKDHDNTLPQNQSELYSSYITNRLNACKDKIAKRGLTNEKIISGAIEIADFMLSKQQLGLEASVKELKDEISNKSIEDIIDILRYARLGRLGAGTEQRFSFVHRRFNEYFVVQRLIEQPQKVIIDAIPTDSRWRDSLVLYCEVASEEEARRIAEFCWSEVRKLTQNNLDLRDPQYLRGIHCLRFLKEAFRARVSCIDTFRKELADFILYQIENTNNLLSKKLAVEAVGLLEPKDIDTTLIKALGIENQWINETALKSCHYLPSLSKELNNRLINFIESIDLFKFYKRRREIIFSLKLSNIFSDLKRYCTWRIIDCYCLFIGCLLFCILFPVIALPSLMWLLMMSFFILVADLIIEPSGELPDFLKRRLKKIKETIQRSEKRSENRQEKPFNANPNGTRLFLSSTLTLVIVSTIFIIITSDNESPILFNPFTSETYIKLIILCLCLILVFSWYQAFYFILPSIVRIDISSVLITLGFSLVTILFFVFSVFFSDFLPLMIIQIILLIIFILLIIMILYWYVKYMYYLVLDYNALREFQRTPGSNRERISKNFFKFHTSKFRLKYIQFLQNEGIRPTGTWLNGQIPNCENDAASTLLAQLEERWLGLDK